MRKKSTAKIIEDDKYADNPKWTREDIKGAMRLHELPANVQRAIRNVRGPQKTPTKVLVSIRLSPDIVETLRASGDGWQTRVDDILRKHL
ncbi:MAG: BrnA antitoxin family protein [Acidobacteriaceae bacterium]